MHIYNNSSFQPYHPSFVPTESDRSFFYTLEEELLRECKEGLSPLNVTALERIPRENWLSLKDENGRSPLHIILSHGPLSSDKNRIDAFNTISALCPDLWNLPDSNEETPLDIIYKNNELNLVSHTLVAICFAKYGEEIFERWNVRTYNVSTFIEQLDDQNNPILICRKLGKESLLKKMMYCHNYYLLPPERDPLPNDLMFPLIWGDVVLVEKYLSEYKMDYSWALRGWLSRLVKIRCNKKLINKIINEIALKLSPYLHFEDRKSTVVFNFLPEFLTSQDFSRIQNLLGITQYCAGQRFNFTPQWDYYLKSLVCFPFANEFIVQHILESNDDKLLKGHLSLGGELQGIHIFDYFCITPSGVEIQVEHLRKVLESARIEKTEFPPYPSRRLAPQKPEILTLLLDHFFEGSEENCENQNLLGSFNSYTLAKIGKSYKGYTISLMEERDFLFSQNGQAVFALYGLYTQKGIDRIIEKEQNTQKLHLLADTYKLLKGEPDDFKELFSQENNNGPITIVNAPQKKEFKVSYHDVDDDGALYVKKFKYDPVQMTEEIRKFVSSYTQKVKERKELLVESFPEYVVEVTKDKTLLHKENDPLPLTFPGIPTVETVRLHFEELKSWDQVFEKAAEEGFEGYRSEHSNFFHVVNELLEKNQTYSMTLLGRVQSMLFSTQNDCLLMMGLALTGLTNDQRLQRITQSLGEWKRIVEAAKGYGINYETAREIQFTEIRTCIHDCKADIDLDLLNKLFASYKKSDYLKELTRKSGKTFETLRTNLALLVSTAIKGENFPQMFEKDSKILAIQLSHVLEMKVKGGDGDDQRHFVCQLAFHSHLCGWGIADIIVPEYKAHFDLFQSDDSLEGINFDSLDLELWGQALNETLNTMTKLALHPRSQNQTRHISSSLSKTLHKHLTLPKDPLKANMTDICYAGADDYPDEDKILQYSESICIPTAIQTIIGKQKESGKKHEVLLDGFLDAIETSGMLLKTDAEAAILALTNKKNVFITNLDAELKNASDILNKLLTYYNPTQNDRREELKNEIQALCLESLALNRQLKEVEQKSLSLKTCSAIAACLPLTVNEKILDAEKGRLVYKNGLLDNKISTLKALKKQSPKEDSFLSELKTQIEGIKKKKKDYLGHYRFDRREMMMSFCEDKGWLNDLYITELGAVKFLELQNKLKKYPKSS